jgi:hypothetical protein
VSDGTRTRDRLDHKKHGHHIESSRYAGATLPDRYGSAAAIYRRFQRISVDLDHQRAPLAQIRKRTQIRRVNHGQGVLAMA